MYEYKIDERDLSFLERNINNSILKMALLEARKKGTFKAKGIYETNRYQLIIDEEQRKLFLDVLSNLFMKEGLEENSEPNTLGLKIEDMIDFFSSKET